jgi:LmbE family N-acetylglucosaminyl deacetylase
MEVDKLLIVAHPDDEVLWGGANLLLEPGWFVVCSTNASNPIRSKEFYKTMSGCNVTRYIMYDVKDEYTEDETVADSLYDGSLFDKGLQDLAKYKWKLVLTHNTSGEYGHEHHRKVSRLVTKYFQNVKYFKPGNKLSNGVLDAKREALIYYRNTQDICKKIFNKKGNTLKVLEREHYFQETVYVSPKREIPKIIHQMWFGNQLDTKSVRYNLMKGVEEVAKKHGFEYKLWTNDNMNPETLPITWDSIQEAIKWGTELGQSRFAQVADLARYELLHRFGGVYLDSLFEIGKPFLDDIVKHSKDELIVANEDPCGLECNNGDGKKYMSNGFFACVPGCINLKRLLHPETLKYIDFENVRINQETGPYFFRLGMKPRDRIYVIHTEKIYPFMVNDSEYRKGQANQCITADDKLLHDCLSKKYKKSLAVYHSGFGGSWSW